jgi:hypothetical protein
MTEADDTESGYKLIVNPDAAWTQKTRLKAQLEKELQRWETIINAIGEARGWGNNPRWDLVIEAGIKVLLSER